MMVLWRGYNIFPLKQNHSTENTRQVSKKLKKGPQISSKIIKFLDFFFLMGEKYVFLNFQTMRVNEKLGVKTLGGIRNICLLTSSFQINEADQSLPCKRWWFKIVRKQRTGGFTVRMSQRQNTKPVKWKESKKRCCVLLCASAADVNFGHLVQVVSVSLPHFHT